jgi:small-conductance mechanosensitive channel
VLSTDLRTFLERRLLTIAGSTITIGSALLAAALLLGAIVLGNLLGYSARRVLKARGATQGAQFAMAKIIRYAVIVFGVVEAVEALGFQLGPLFAASAVLAVGIGFGLQNIAQNFISGVILLIEQPVRHGDFIKVGGTLGTVDDIGLRATHIVTRDQVTIIVPNSALISAEVVNHSRPTTNLRVRIGVPVAYGADTAKASEVLLRVAADNDGVMKTPAPEVRLEDFADSSLAFALYVWIEFAKEDLLIGSRLRFAIDAAFREAGLEIPVPQREISVRSGPPIPGPFPHRNGGKGVD